MFQHIRQFKIFNDFGIFINVFINVLEQYNSSNPSFKFDKSSILELLHSKTFNVDGNLSNFYISTPLQINFYNPSFKFISYFIIV